MSLARKIIGSYYIPENGSPGWFVKNPRQLLFDQFCDIIIKLQLGCTKLQYYRKTNKGCGNK